MYNIMGLITIDEAQEAKKRVLIKRQIRLRLKEIGFPEMELNHIKDLKRLEEILYNLIG